MVAWLDDYVRFTGSAGQLSLHNWTVLSMTGNDRVRFLHGLCTNDIRRLESGRGCEAFATQVQGKVVGHVLVLADSDRLILVGAPGQAATLIKHWERYHIREDISIQDHTDEQQIILLGGPDVPPLLERISPSMSLPPRIRLAHRSFQCDDVTVQLIWFDAEEWLLLSKVSGDQADRWRQMLRDVGIHPCDVQVWDALRLEIGWPMYGQDIVPDNFPQEVGRDQWAISFTKGCYLGQETVARIDALGHVNRKLRGLRWPSQITCTPATGYSHEGKLTAYVTSVSYSPRLAGLLAMAYVRRPWEEPGSLVPLADGVTAEVLAFPIPRRQGEFPDGTS